MQKLACFFGFHQETKLVLVDGEVVKNGQTYNIIGKKCLVCGKILEYYTILPWFAHLYK